MEPFLITALIIGASFLYPFILIRMIKKHYRKHYNENKHKISDADIFKLMSRANHFLTNQQLAEVSPLTPKEAQKHLMYFAMEGIIKRYQDGGVHSIYQLREALPEDKVLPISIHGLSDQQVVDAILKYSGDYQITVAEICVVFGLDVEEAKRVLQRLKKAKLVHSYWKGFSRIHVFQSPLNQKEAKFKIPELQQQKIALKNTHSQQHRIKIPDADVIRLAVEHQGKITPTLLCLKLKIPLREASTKLEELYEQGAFVLHVHEENATVEYELRDKNLLA